MDPTIRHAFRDQSQCSVATGRSYLSDTTSEEDAIFVEPVERPCQVTANDNLCDQLLVRRHGVQRAATCPR